MRSFFIVSSTSRCPPLYNTNEILCLGYSRTAELFPRQQSEGDAMQLMRALGGGDDSIEQTQAVRCKRPEALQTSFFFSHKVNYLSYIKDFLEMSVQLQKHAKQTLLELLQ